jgi:uncharacterized membrane protein
MKKLMSKMVIYSFSFFTVIFILIFLNYFLHKQIKQSSHE